jgi:hypothetical protein
LGDDVFRNQPALLALAKVRSAASIVQFRIKGQLWPEKYQSAPLDCELHLADLQAFLA